MRLLGIVELLCLYYSWKFQICMPSSVVFMYLQMHKIGCVNYVCFPKSSHIYCHPQTTKLSCIFSPLIFTSSWCMKISPYASLEWWSGLFSHLLFVCSVINFSLSCLIACALKIISITVIQSCFVAIYVWFYHASMLASHGISLFVRYCVTMC